MGNQLRLNILVSPNHKHYQDILRIYTQIKKSKRKGGITNYLINAILSYEQLQNKKIQLSDADVDKISNSVVSKLLSIGNAPLISHTKNEVSPVPLTASTSSTTSVVSPPPPPPTILSDFDNTEIHQMDDDTLDMLKLFDD